MGETPTPGGKQGEAWPCSAFHEAVAGGKPQGGGPGWLPSACATYLGAEGHGGLQGVQMQLSTNLPLPSGLAHSSKWAAALGQSLAMVAGQ